MLTNTEIEVIEKLEVDVGTLKVERDNCKNKNEKLKAELELIKSRLHDLEVRFVQPLIPDVPEGVTITKCEYYVDDKGVVVDVECESQGLNNS